MIDPILGLNDRVCSDFVFFFLVRSGSFTFLLDSKCQCGLYCVYKKKLSLSLIFDARRSNQHMKVPPTFPLATGDAFLLLLIGSPDERAANGAPHRFW